MVVAISGPTAKVITPFTIFAKMKFVIGATPIQLKAILQAIAQLAIHVNTLATHMKAFVFRLKFFQIMYTIFLTN